MRTASFRVSPGTATFCLVAIGIGVGAAFVLGMGSLASDEHYYGPQVRRFVAGVYELEPGITMLPGYHAALAAVLSILGGYQDAIARLVNLLGSLALLPLFAAIARREDPTGAPMRSAQAFLQPLLFPYLFLIYTEAWSIAALAGMLIAVFGRQYVLAGVLGLAMTLMRQDYVLWVGFAWLLALLEGVEPGRWREQWGRLAGNAFRAAPLLLVMVTFVAFVAWNGSIAVADREVHATPFNLANLWFFLLCAFAVLLPHHLQAAPRVLRLARRPLVAAALAAAFVFYVATWSNPHPYNQAHLRFWLHNELLYLMDHSLAWRAALFVPMAWSALSLWSTPLPDWRFRALHAFAVLMAVLHPLVEQRYYLPALTLYVLWRPHASRRWEWATLCAYLVVALFLLRGISTARFFL